MMFNECRGDYRSALATTARRMLTVCVAETVGTAILLFVSCLAAHQDRSSNHYHPIQGYLASGIAVTVIMHLFANVSGAHVNPMTTVAAVVTKEIPVVLCAPYIIGQIVGSITGYGLVLTVLPHGTRPGLTKPSPNIANKEALIIEFLITLILCLANCASWDKRNDRMRDSAAIRFGLLVTAMNLIAAPLTGASMNPARSFGPALWCNDWYRHWIYWVAPLSAGVVGSSFYRVAFWPSSTKDAIV